MGCSIYKMDDDIVWQCMKVQWFAVGGAAIVYLSNLMLRFDDKSKLKADEGMGINGAIVDVTLVKSRSNRAGKVASLVFNQEEGYDEILSEYLLLKNNGRINGAVAYLYIGKRDDMKFAQKNFKTKFQTEPEFSALVISEVLDVLKAGIEDVDTTYAADSDIASMVMAKLREEEMAVA